MLADLEAGVFCSLPFIVQTLWFHGKTPAAQGVAILAETFRIDHLLPDNDGNDVKEFVNVLMIFICIIALVQDEVSEREIWLLFFDHVQ